MDDSDISSWGISNSSDSSVNRYYNANSSNDLELEQIVVTAGRRQKLLEKTQSFSVIRPEEWQGTTKSVADVIAEQTGIQTIRYGGTGSFQTVSVRGIQGNKVLVLLDGIPLNSAMGGAVDLGGISPQRIGEIEIYKGVVPGEFGGNSLGGVINLRSKNMMKSQTVASSMSRGAYGYRNHYFEAASDKIDNVYIFGSADYTSSDNDWPFLNRNRTPYNPHDDRKDTVQNHHYSHFETRIHPSVSFPNERVLSSGISFSTSKMGLPAEEGHVNRTAIFDRNIFSFTTNLQNDSEHLRFNITPQLGYMHWSGRTVWTSNDESMGTSHGTIGSFRNGWAQVQTDLHVLNASANTDYYLTDNVVGQIGVHGKHSQIKTTSQATQFTPADWPGSSQELSITAGVNSLVPVEGFEVGLSLGGSVKAIRSFTKGGQNSFLALDLDPTDTVEYPWSAYGGVHLRPSKKSLVFFNVARYSHIPGLREKFGTNGKIYPNPDLKEEVGFSLEGGYRYLGERIFFESVLFSNKMEDAILLLTHVDRGKYVNLARASARGLESTLRIEPIRHLSVETRVTLQDILNKTHMYTYYGNKIPNEPGLSGLFKTTVGPLKGMTIQYWLDYKSFFFRDYANKQRVPHSQEQFGTVSHNGMVSWSSGDRLSLSVSFRNFDGDLMRYEDVVTTPGSDRSWVLVPKNEWSVTAKVSF
ncbi:TonB-dependent receptor [Chitinispirillum alkaliphilum]|nr:TonB-dependent receptor [Chitinispirillum alkaliphilum]